MSTPLSARTVDNTLPLVSLGLPMYKSSRFLGTITQNLDTFTNSYPNIEIICSDRHLADDALEVLSTRYRGDSRFRFLAARDEIGWVENYNVLLAAARGKYFFWMPHDDTYSPNYITGLVALLEQHPDALVGYGTMLRRNLGETTWDEHIPRPPFSNWGAWTVWSGFQAFLAHQIGSAIHGLLRREPLMEKRLFMLSTLKSNAADFVWMSSLAFHGRWVWAEECVYDKTHYPSSTGAAWKPRNWTYTLREIPILRSYLVDSETTARRRMRGWLILVMWTALRLGGNLRDLFSANERIDNLFRPLLLKGVGSPEK
jgi:glycosyltransferase involved in cell wall biosynthesis